MRRSITLSNGVELPRCGLGTFKSAGDECKAAVKAALASGIRHIDTAAIYKNEEAIAEALQEAGCPRDSVFITSKLSPYQQGRDKAEAACQDILTRLKTDYVDLLLVHWPGVSRVPPGSELNAQLRWQTWQVLQEWYRSGRARAIGVSNYQERHLSELLAQAQVAPMVNQFELHPRWQCAELQRACQAAGVAVVAYASLGCGKLLDDPVVQGVAQQLGKSPAQVLLRWALDKGAAVIPKSVRPERIAEWSEEQLLGGWELSPEHTVALDALGRPPNPELLDEYSRQVSEQALKQVLSSSASAPSTAQGGAKKEPPGYEDGQAAPWPGEGAFAAMKGAVQRQSPQASSQPAPSASDPQGVLKNQQLEPRGVSSAPMEDLDGTDVSAEDNVPPAAAAEEMEQHGVDSAHHPLTVVADLKGREFSPDVRTKPYSGVATINTAAAGAASYAERVPEVMDSGSRRLDRRAGSQIMQALQKLRHLAGRIVRNIRNAFVHRGTAEYFSGLPPGVAPPPPGVSAARPGIMAESLDAAEDPSAR